jgi:hypothetical protein
MASTPQRQLVTLLPEPVTTPLRDRRYAER